VSRPGPTRRYPRTARLNRVVQEIVAEELEQAADDRLGFVTVVDVEVAQDLKEAVVWFTWLPADEDGSVAAPHDLADDEAATQLADARAERDEALAQMARRIHVELNRQVRMRAIPRLTFREDPAAQAGARVERILRGLDLGPTADSDDPSAEADDPGDPSLR
jgi:ribosome-binding factor A